MQSPTSCDGKYQNDLTTNIVYPYGLDCKETSDSQIFEVKNANLARLSSGSAKSDPSPLVFLFDNAKLTRT